MTKTKTQISNECQMTNDKKLLFPVNVKTTYSGEGETTNRFGKHFDIGILDLIWHLDFVI